MPTFKKPSQDDLYDRLKDLLQIQEKQFAIDEGGEINNPSAYDYLIKGYEDIINDPSISEDDRRDAQKQLRNLQIKQLKTDLDQKKKIDVGDLRQMIEQDLRELEFEYPNNPVAYSAGAAMKYEDILEGTSEREGLNQLIKTFEENGVDVTSLQNYKNECLEELNKYSDIVDAFERGDMERLSEYAVVYTPYANKTNAMQIVFKGSVRPEYSQRTNIAFTRDAAGRLITTENIDGLNGLQVFFVKAGASRDDRISFANSQFEYGLNGIWETENPSAFNSINIKHAPLHSIPSGSFVKDSKDKLYYINRDRSFYPVRNEAQRKELGFKEGEFYKLSPDEEINTLRGAIDHSTYPVFEKYAREAAEVSSFDQFAAFKEGLKKEIAEPSLFKELPEHIGRAERAIGEVVKREVPKAAKGFWELTKESFEKGVQTLRERLRGLKTIPTREIQPRPETKWGLEGLKELPAIKSAKKTIKELTP